MNCRILYSALKTFIKRQYCTGGGSSHTKDYKPIVRTSSITLSKHIQSLIKLSGPITVADYMKEVLTNPLSGYYMHKDVFGHKGDFITSPEVGQLFGEMVSIWFMNELNKIGSPRPLQLVELGPGRGTLCQDILKVFKHFNSLNNVSVHLVEVSPHLSRLQAERLCDKVEDCVDTQQNYYKSGMTKCGVPIFWYNHLQNVPKQFSIVIAHEFFDALPVHKFQKTKDGWREVLVGYDEKADCFRYMISSSVTPTIALFVDKNEQREHLEVCVEGLVLIENLASRLEEDGGFALIVDYGHCGDKSDTFRSFKDHKLHDPLIDPGTADLTADVDFSRLIKVAAANNKLITFGPVTQNDFLSSMGIDIRLEILLQNASDKNKEILKQGYSMIMDKDKMGERFKFLSLFPSVLKDHLAKYPVVGFDKT